jgi:hypothetical protein
MGEKQKEKTKQQTAYSRRARNFARPVLEVADYEKEFPCRLCLRGVATVGMGVGTP